MNIIKIIIQHPPFQNSGSTPATGTFSYRNTQAGPLRANWEGALEQIF